MKNAAQTCSSRPCQKYQIAQQLGDCHASMGNLAQAKRHYERAADLEPDEAGPYVGMGVVSLQKNGLEDAEIAFRVACRLNPLCSQAYAGLAMIAQQRDNFQKAFDLYLRSLELDTNNLTALLGLFQTSCQMGSFAQVIHYLEIYLQMHPTDTSVMFSLAALYVKDGRIEESQRLLADLVTLAPDNQDAANLLEEIQHGLAQKALRQADLVKA